MPTCVRKPDPSDSTPTSSRRSKPNSVQVFSQKWKIAKVLNVISGHLLECRPPRHLVISFGNLAEQLVSKTLGVSCVELYLFGKQPNVTDILCLVWRLRLLDCFQNIVLKHLSLTSFIYLLLN